MQWIKLGKQPAEVQEAEGAAAKAPELPPPHGTVRDRSGPRQRVALPAYL